MTNAPELAAYPANVRGLLVQRALFALQADSKTAKWLGIALPLGFAVVGVFVGLWVMGYFPGGRSKSELIVISIQANYSGGAIGCAVGGLVWLLARAWMLRPYLHKAIEEHEQTCQSGLNL